MKSPTILLTRGARMGHAHCCPRRGAKSQAAPTIPLPSPLLLSAKCLRPAEGITWRHVASCWW